MFSKGSAAREQSPGEPRVVQASPEHRTGAPRRAHESSGEPKRAHGPGERPGDPTRAQASTGESRGAQEEPSPCQPTSDILQGIN